MKKRFWGGLPPLLTLLLFIWACKKEVPPEERVSGTVQEVGTDKPLVGAKVYVSTCSGSLLEPSNCGTLDSAVTDSDGRYYISLGDRIPSKVQAYYPGCFSDTETEVAPTVYEENI